MSGHQKDITKFAKEVLSYKEGAADTHGGTAVKDTKDKQGNLVGFYVVLPQPLLFVKKNNAIYTKLYTSYK